MRRSGMKVAGMAALCGVCATGIVLGATGKTPTKRATPKAAKKARLLSFNSCAALDRYVTARAVPMTGPYGIPGIAGTYAERTADAGGVTVPTASPAPTAAVPAPATAPTEGTDFSGTNTQEAGVDEPDVVKSDGRYAYMATSGTIRSMTVGADPKLLDTLPLKDVYGDAQLLLAGDRLLVITNGAGPIVPVPAPGPVPVPATTTTAVPPGDVSVGSGGVAVADVAPTWIANTGTVVHMVDVSDPAHLHITETLRLEGRFLAARDQNGAVRLVISTTPNPVGFVAPGGAEGVVTNSTATLANRQVVRNAPITAWLPMYSIQHSGDTKSTIKTAVKCREVRYPTQFSGLSTLTVLTINPQKGLEPVDRDSVLTDGEIVYGSQTSLYVSTPRWMSQARLASGDAPANSTTQIHRFEVTSPTATAYRASGVVPGFLMSQWSMSEKDGVLRVASTDEPSWGPDGQQLSASQSQVTTLVERSGRLVRLGGVNGLGKGERIYAVRFIGDTGYVVTFRQMDPLYVIDVGDPAKPVVRGELKIPGYSAYLHPVGDGLLLGVGQDATDQGRATGTQVSLFNVSDPARPKRVAVLRMSNGWSEAENDHHAFLYWPATRLAVIPVTNWDPVSGDSHPQAVGVTVGDTGITRLGAVANRSEQGGWDAQIRRSMVSGSTLLTFSESGVRASDLATLQPTGWAAFPTP